MSEPTIKTYDDWSNSKQDLDHFLSVGDVVDEPMYYYFLEVLPPATNLTNLIQIGEPHSHVHGRATFSTLQRVNGQWIFRGNCHQGKTEEPKERKA